MQHPKATPTTGPPERTPEDRPAKPGDTQPRAAAHRRKGHPGHAGTNPTGEVAGRKKKHRHSPNDSGRGDGDQETQDRDTLRRTPQSHNTTGPKTRPPPQLKKKRGGEGRGQTPSGATPAHPHTPPEEGGKQTRRTQEATRPNSQARKKRSAGKTRTHKHTHTTNPSQERRSGPKPVSRHTHPRPQLGMASLLLNPTPNARTTKPSPKWRGKAQTRAQAHAP